MKLKPLHDWAVIVPAEAAARTAGGLYIPDSAKEKPEEGVVEAIGPGAFEEEKPGKKKDKDAERKFIPTTVKPGDRVLYERWAGRNHKIGNDERILVRERDILGMIDRPPQLPAATTSTSVTALVERHISVPTTVKPATAATSLQAGTKKAVTKTAKTKAAKKTVKKAAKKTVKKAAKKTVKKSTTKAKAGKAKKAAKKKPARKR